MKFEESEPESYIDMGYEEEEELATDKLEMVFIELKKFIQKNPDAESDLNQWLWLIVGKEEKIKMAKKENKKIKKAIEIIDEMSMDEKEWELYESRRRAIMNYNTGMKNSKMQGIEEGIEIGRADGLAKGEIQAKRETAKNLLDLGVEVDKIIKATGLSKEEIEKILKKDENKSNKNMK